MLGAHRRHCPHHGITVKFPKASALGILSLRWWPSKSKEDVSTSFWRGAVAIFERFKFLDTLCLFLLAGTVKTFQFFFHKCTTVSKKPEPDRLRAALHAPLLPLWAVSGQDCSERPSASSLGGQTCGWRPLLW